MNYQLLMTMPFWEAMTLIAKGAVDDYLNRSGLLTAIAEVVKREQQSEPQSLDSKGVLEFLNANGYPMKKGQLYKLTSDPNSGIPFQKFGSRLHFYKSQLIAWAESRLINGNAVGYLPPADTKKKGGSR